MNPIYLVFSCILLVFQVWTIYNVRIVAVGVKHLLRTWRKKREASEVSGERLPAFSIIVPVKDEERVVERLLNGLLGLDYPPEKREIIVVEDGSLDRTVEMCREFSRGYPSQVRLVRRSVSDGKPSALNHALKHVRGEIVGVFDADNVPEPDMLMRAVKYFEDPLTAAVQGRQCSINADENMLTKFVSYEEGVRYETYLRGKDILNLFVPLTGSCYFVRRSVLEKVGGWDGESLSEDMELSVRLTERGYKIRYASDVRSWQENPANLIQFFRQRTRWFRGSMEVSLKYGRLLKRLNRRCIDAEITLAGPYMFIPCLLVYLMGIYSFLNLIQPDFLLMIMAQVAMLLTALTLFLIGVGLFYLTKPRKLTNLLWLPFVYAYWSIQNLIALYALIQIILKRPRRWVKTTKTGTVTKINVVR